MTRRGSPSGVDGRRHPEVQTGSSKVPRLRVLRLKVPRPRISRQVYPDQGVFRPRIPKQGVLKLGIAGTGAPSSEQGSPRLGVPRPSVLP